jgi:hypothetical protein
MDMDIEDIERELAALGLTPSLESDRPVSEEEVCMEIEKTAQTMDENLRRRADAQVLHRHSMLRRSRRDQWLPGSQ